jgi:hypothetical protein
MGREQGGAWGCYGGAVGGCGREPASAGVRGSGPGRVKRTGPGRTPGNLEMEMAIEAGPERLGWPGWQGHAVGVGDEEAGVGRLIAVFTGPSQDSGAVPGIDRLRLHCQNPVEVERTSGPKSVRESEACP